MAENSKIEWTDATWNPITGCSVISPGCTNCYAMKLAGTRLKHHVSRVGLTRENNSGPVWTGEVRFNEQWIAQPREWKRPRRIFVCAHGDLFHENVPDEWIDRVFRQMGIADHHTFQVLTKRAARMAAYMRRSETYLAYNSARMASNVWPAPNVWLGVSVEDQRRADERIPHLLAVPAAKRFLSCEPLLGRVELDNLRPGSFDERGTALRLDALTAREYHEDDGSQWTKAQGRIDWVICGGESGPGARPMRPDWARSLRDQCQEAGVPFHFKQWGEWKPGDGDTAYGQHFYRVGKKAAGATLDGREWREFPA